MTGSRSLPGTNLAHFPMPQISAWQGGKDPLNTRLRACWPVAGTFVLALRKPDTIGDHSFQDVHTDCSKGRRTIVFGKDAGRGGSVRRHASILSKTAGACD